MKKIFIALIVSLMANSAIMAQTQINRLKAHVYYLASDELRGRKAGSEDAHKASLYLVEQYQQMGTQPLFDSYLMPFDTKGPEAAAMLTSEFTANDHYRNIVVIIPGNDPVLKNEYILLGAHYDHLGIKNSKEGDNIYNGADDNASGSAAVVEVARQLMARQSALKRSVVIANFDAEEIGLVGSNALMSRLKNEGRLDQCRLMMSIDMVGWLRQSGHLILEGSGTIHHGSRILEEVADRHNLNIRTKSFENSVFTATDTEPFASHQIPTLAVTTGLKSPYHKPGDEAQLIDYEGLSTITDYLADLAVTLSADPDFRSSGRVANKHKDKLPLIEIGLALDGGRDGLRFNNLALTTDYGWGWGGGASLLVNINRNTISGLDLKASALYDRFWTPYLSESHTWDSYTCYHQQSIKVPLELQYRLISISGQSLYIGLGAYYQHPIGHHFDETGLFRNIASNQWGWMWSFGARLGRWDLEAAFDYGIGSMMDSTPTHLRSTRAILTYWLW